MSTSKKTQFSANMRIVSLNENGTVLVNESPEKDSYGDLSGMFSQGKQEAAYQDGWSACEQQYQQQMDQLNHQYQEQLSRLHDQLNAVNEQLPLALNEYFTELERQIRQEVCDLALKISELMIGQQLEKHDIIEEVIHNALVPLVNVRGIVIHLNPDLVSSIEAGGKECRIPAGVEIVADPALGVGEAMLDSSQGFIDATISGRLAVLREELRNALSEEREGNV